MAVLYRHVRLDSNQPFYIGIGKTEKRAYSKHGRNDHWKRIVKKHGYKVHIMMDDLRWEEAQQKEQEFIQLYGRKDLGLGTLVNLTDGGDGAVGLVFTQESKAKISAALIGKPNPKVSAARTGKKQSEEHKAKIGAAKTGKKLSAEHIAKLRKPKPKLSAALTGRKLSAEHCANISAAGKGKKLSPETIAKRTGKKRGPYKKSTKTQ